MPSPIPSPLNSTMQWFKESHLRLLVAGLVAVGLIASISIFAAEPSDYTIPEQSEAELDRLQVSPAEEAAAEGEEDITDEQAEVVPEVGNEEDDTLEDTIEGQEETQEGPIGAVSGGLIAVAQAQGFPTTPVPNVIQTQETVSVTAPISYYQKLVTLYQQRVNLIRDNLAKAKKAKNQAGIKKAQQNLTKALKNLKQAEDNLRRAKGQSGSSVKKGNVKVTVFRARDGKRPAKQMKVRLTISPKCNVTKKRTNQQGVATFAGCPVGQHTVTLVPPRGYEVRASKIRKVSVKAKKQQKIKFVIKKKTPGAKAPNPVASKKPTTSAPKALTSPTPAATVGPATTPVASATPAVSGGTGTQGGGSGDVQGVGSLPKTGQAGLVVFLTFLVASAVYYGGRRYLAKRNK